MFSSQWLGIIRDVASEMLERKRQDLNNSVLAEKANQYRGVLKTSPLELAAIQKFNPSFKVLEKFNSVIVENFFKYRGYEEATRLLAREVVAPWVAASLVEAAVTTDNLASCQAGGCGPELEQAERHLIAPIELFKMRKVLII